MSAIGTLPSDWRDAIGPAASASKLAKFEAAVAAARAKGDVYPPAEGVFAALRWTPYECVRAVIIGQDPYVRPGQAHGLAFSVGDGYSPLPPSLRNIRRELEADVGVSIPESGSLVRWAEHGVLLLNAILTVERGKPGSHRSLGWQELTSAVVRAVESRDQPVAFLLWGRFAQDAAGPIDTTRHVVERASHPSPLSQKGFLGTRPFSRANEQLAKLGASAVDWALE